MDAIMVITGAAPALRDNPAAVYLGSLRASGRRAMAAALDKVARLCGIGSWQAMPWAQLRYEHLQALRTRLSETCAPATTNLHLAAVRGTMKQAWLMGLVDAERYAQIKAVPVVRGSTLPAGRAVASGELAAIMRACQEDRSDAGARDAAIVATAYAGGLRRAELAGLTLDSLQDGDDTLTIRLTGKGGKERLVYLDNGAALALRAWLAIRGAQPGALFSRGRKGGRVLAGAGMTPQAIRDVVARRAQQAGVAHVSPHDLRRSFVSDMLDAGVDIATVAAMAGHASVNTTARYDRRGEQGKRRAAKSLHVPYLRQERLTSGG
jgi:integrase